MKKLFNNFGYQSLQLLGFRQYFLLFFKTLWTGFDILEKKNLAPLDQQMSSVSPLRVRHRLGSFNVDIAHNDREYHDGTHAFGAIRELYIRDCYTWYFKNLNPKDLKTVVDLGGNRGLFSLLCSPFAERIVIVEALPILNDLIRYNLNFNNFTNFTIVNKFIGTGGKLFFDGHQHETMTFQQLKTQTQLDTIDFLKMDIEGGEYTLFKEDIDWSKIKYIAMEIHPHFGDNKILTTTLEKNNFHVATFTADLQVPSSLEKATMLYAYNQNLVK